MTVADRDAHADRLERIFLVERAASAFAHADRLERPFRHWRFNDALPEALCREIIALSISLPPTLDSLGKRSSLNEYRRFFSPEMQQRYPAAGMIAELFQSEPVVQAIETLCNIDCSGSYLRIEYCQDQDGFWLEPHMDIKENIVTIQIYLNTGFDAEDLHGSIQWTGAIDQPHFWRAWQRYCIRTVSTRKLARRRKAANQGCSPIASRELRHE